MSPLTIGRSVLGSGPGIGPDPFDFASQANHNPVEPEIDRLLASQHVQRPAVRGPPLWK